MNYKEVYGNLITLGSEGEFDVITHGCNCFCQMGAGIAPQMAKAFGCDKFPKEAPEYKGDINKLGTIDYQKVAIGHGLGLIVVNSYSQYHYGRNHADGVSKPLDYDALTLCLRKINHTFKGKHIGLPQIGAGLAGGNWNRIKNIIQQELRDCEVTVVIFSK